MRYNYTVTLLDNAGVMLYYIERITYNTSIQPRSHLDYYMEAIQATKYYSQVGVFHLPSDLVWNESDLQRFYQQELRTCALAAETISLSLAFTEYLFFKF